MKISLHHSAIIFATIFSFNVTAQTNTFPASGNVGIGITSPGAALSFEDVESNNSAGMTWHSPTPLLYGIYRTPGTWTSPDYQQLKLKWETGVVIDPGTLYSKSYLDIKGNGLRVTSGNVGIGTSNPAAKLHVDGNFLISNPAFTGTFSIQHHANGHIRFVNSVIGDFMNIGPGNEVDFGVQQIRSVNRGAHFSSPVGGVALSTDIGQIVLNAVNGNTLIGTATDNGNKLQVNGTISSTGFILPIGASVGKVLTSDADGAATWQTAPTAGWAFNGNSEGILKTIGTTDNIALPFITNNTEQMRITASGNIGIGTSTPSEKLAVNGNIVSRKVKVTQTGWPDYVFHATYRLTPLHEVEAFIKKHQHLPEIPSAAEVEKNGLDLGDNQAVLLKKIEELMLYVIDLKKENEEQDKKIQALQKRR